MQIDTSLTILHLSRLPGRQREASSQVLEQESDLVHPTLEPFFKMVNDKPLMITKAIWPLYFPLQIIGLFNEKIGKFAKAFYGLCWSIVYSCFRPFAKDRKVLQGNKIDSFTKGVYKANEHFRFGMGSLVSAIYGGGALGMFAGLITGNDDFFDRSANVYMTGMMNQNQIFASMNGNIFFKRKLLEKNLLSKDQIEEVDRSATNGDLKRDMKGNLELVDTIFFIPNIITRALGTLRLFGLNLSALTEKIVDSLGCFSYGTWAARFGTMKTIDDSKVKGGDLKPVNPGLNGAAKKTDQVLYAVQKKCGLLFSILLPAFSWTAAVTELFGFREIAEKIFKWEGVAERLHPTIASWCIRDTWLNGNGAT